MVLSHGVCFYQHTTSELAQAMIMMANYISSVAGHTGLLNAE